MGIAWTDEETGLLLNAIVAFKNEITAKGLNWNIIRSKYEDIHNKFISLYLLEAKDNDMNDFPNKDDPTVFTKAMIMGKIKRIKNSYREALRSGKRNGGGRIVYQFYNICVQIWDTIVPTEPTSNEIETSSGQFIKFQTDDESYHESFDDPMDSPQQFPTIVKEEFSSTTPKVQDNESECAPLPSPKIDPSPMLKPKKPNNKRPFLTSRFAKRSDENTIAQAIREEREFKRQCLDLLEDSNRELKATTREFMKNMNSITKSMNEGFAMIRNIMTQQLLMQSYSMPSNNDSNSPNNFANFSSSDLPAHSHIVIPTSPPHETSPDELKESSELFSFRVNRDKL